MLNLYRTLREVTLLQGPQEQNFYFLKEGVRKPAIRRIVSVQLMYHKLTLDQ